MSILWAKLIPWTQRKPGILYQLDTGECRTADAAQDDSREVLEAIERLSEHDRITLARKLEAIHAQSRTRH